MATTFIYIAQALEGLNQHPEALPLHQQALRIRHAALGPAHPLTRQSREDVQALQPPPQPNTQA